MAKVYALTLSEEELRQASDMLRYDGAYEVQTVGNGEYRVYTTHFTEARWRSFGVRPRVIELMATAREHQAKCEMAHGFTEGIRFAQRLLGGRLIEG